MTQAWLATAFLATLGALVTWDLSRHINGPQFLLLYLLLLCGTLVGQARLRRRWIDWIGISVMGALIFETVGLTRLLAGAHAGMRRFGLLIVMMLVGGALHFLRAEHFAGGNSRDGGCATFWGWGGCSGGGGGCGGGGTGCGGCGSGP